MYKTLFLTIYILSALTAAVVFAKPGTEDYAAEPVTDQLVISPSGKLVLFLLRNDDKQIVKVVNIITGDTKAMLDVSAITPRYIYFIDEDKTILRVTEDKWVRGFIDFDERSSAFLFDLKTGGARQLLTPGEEIILGQTGIGKVVGVSTDLKYAYMPAFTRREGRESSRIPDYSLMKVDLAEDSKPRIAERGHRHVIDYFIKPTGEVVATEKYSKNSHLYTIEAAEGKDWREIYRDDSDLRKFVISGLTADYKNLVLITEDEDTNRISCFTMSLATGKISDQLFSRDDADISYLLTDVNRVVYGVAYDGFLPSYNFFDTKISEKVAAIQAKFSGHSVWLVANSDNYRHIGVYVEGPNYAGDYFLFSDGEKPRHLLQTRPQFSKNDIHNVVPMNYKARDGMVLPMLVTIPNARAKTLKNIPTVMMPHGGPESYDKIEFDWLAQALANEGYLVLQPQFRGSRGFGIKHLNAGHGEWGKKMQTDLSDAVQTMVKEGITDKNRVCIVGWSYGGYAALAGGAFDSETYKCQVSVNGVSDLKRMLKTEKREKNRYIDVYAYWKEVITKGEYDKEFLASISPAEHAGNFVGPTLIIYSDEDEVVLPRQSTLMINALKAAGKPLEVLRIKKEGHSFEEPENRKKTLDAIIKFLKKSI